PPVCSSPRPRRINSLKFKTFEKLYRDSSQTIVARNFVISPSGILKCVLYKYSEIPNSKTASPKNSKRSLSINFLFRCSFTYDRSEEHTSELQSRFDLVCRLLLEKNKTIS